jgi:flavin-binding protein dodecin
MAKKQSDGVYRIIDVVGVSEKSWEDAGPCRGGDGRQLAA